MNDSDKLIVALDMPDSKVALSLLERLSDYVGFFKIGLELFIASGPAIVTEALKRNAKVFLDLKLHDIPNTVERAALQASRLGAHMLTVHTLGGEEMMRRAVKAVSEGSRREGWAAPKLLGVTVLTSLDQQGLSAVGVRMPVEHAVSLLAGKARQAGLDGVVASPRELKVLRQSGLGELLFVTPGIRPAGGASQDQARITTPSEAISDGADFLVVGRPITHAADPVEAAREIVEEIRRAS